MSNSIAPEIPDETPWLPRLTVSTPPQKGASHERYTGVHVAKQFSKMVTTTYRWSQHWKRVDYFEIDCGLSAGKSYEVRVGITEAESTELTSRLSVAVEGIGAEIGSTMISQVTKERSESQTLTLNDLHPNKCQRLRVAIWQLVDEFIISAESVGRLRHKHRNDERRFQVPQNSTRTRTMLIDADECCDDQARRHADMERYSLSFPGGERVLYGSRGDDGTVTLEGVQGQYSLGDTVALNSLATDEEWLSVPEGKMLTYGVLSPAADSFSEDTESEESLEADERAVVHALFEMPLNDLGQMFDGSEEVVAYVTKIRELTSDGEPPSFEDILGVGFSEEALTSLAARILSLSGGEKVETTEMALAGDIPVFLYAATYRDRIDAFADFDQLVELHTAELLDAYDVAVVTKDDVGAVQVEMRGTPARRVASGGFAVRAAIEKLLPREFGDILDENKAALIAIGESPVEERFNKALARAEESVEKKIDASSGELGQNLKGSG